jgi:hypothetical protein
MNGGNGWVNDKAVPLLRGAPPQVRKRDHDVSHAADIDETSEESKPARCLKWVKMRKSRIEYKWSDLAQRADVTADMVNRQQRAMCGRCAPGTLATTVDWFRDR